MELKTFYSINKSRIEDPELTRYMCQCDGAGQLRGFWGFRQIIFGQICLSFVKGEV